ncbi:hypothetical protein [Chitiniphilus eburneus]|uniref:Uncharacterized protein n=1 Tax=Chitiniphilus eburneus TaxID=2571148 RepID=A0A4V5MPK4_9NEIS|nr:hypothetical protein [Chitiniphilus eburneus]TJZ65808.1 hypothetical protein FAZ21_17845 [Chitiniphilus eburneus]
MSLLEDAGRWERIRLRGWRYAIFWRGTLLWGFSFAILFAALESITGRQTDYVAAVLDILPFGMIAGTVYGLALWGYCLLQSVKQNHAKEEKQ